MKTLSKTLLALSLLLLSANVFAGCQFYTVYENGQYRNVQVCDNQMDKINNDLLNRIANPKKCKSILIDGRYRRVCY